MKKIKLVAFDLDGTLVDAYKAVCSSLNHAMETFGYEKVDDYSIKRNVGWGESKLIRNFVPPDDFDKVLSVYRQHHRTALKFGTTFLPGAKELLNELTDKNYRLSIASNRPSRFTHIILKHLEIRDHFEYVICGDEVQNPKPAGDLLLKTLEKFGLDASEAVYVGDMTIDVQTGHEANMKTIAVLTGSSTKEEVLEHNPYQVIDHVGEVTEIVENIATRRN